MTTEERVRRLERENRWVKVAGGALMLCLIVALFGGAGQDQEKVPDLVKAREFVIVAKDGTQCGSFCASPIGASLTLGGKDKQVELRLDATDRRSLHPSDPSAFLYGSSIQMQNHGNCISLLATSEIPQVVISHGASGRGANIRFGPDGTAFLTIHDKGTKVVFEAKK